MLKEANHAILLSRIIVNPAVQKILCILDSKVENVAIYVYPMDNFNINTHDIQCITTYMKYKSSVVELIL